MPPQVLEREVQVGDRAVRALCTLGPREAVLLHGASDGADVWLQVLERLDGIVGACAYERARSDAPRGWFELLDEMRRAHGALGFAGSYTLVGHSIAGMYARLYAVDRPTDLGGLVLVDPVHEDMPEGVRAWMTRAAWDEWMRRRDSPNADGVRETELAKRAARAGRISAVPVTVITSMRGHDGAGWSGRFPSEAARQVHARLLDGVTNGRHVPASRSGHDVHLDEPELVAREIVRVVLQSRGRER
jgi:pimeloyl-ACP methyl ester carboxylesterase